MRLTSARAIAIEVWSRAVRDAWYVAAAAAVGAIALGAAIPSRARAATIGHLLAAGVAPAGQARYSGYVVLRSRDCSGSLSFLRLLSRPTVARALTLRGVWLVGAPTARDSVGAAMASYDVTGVPVRLAPRQLVAALSEVGARRTPVLLVTDSTGSLRHVFDMPTTAAEYVAVAQALEGLTPRIP